MIQRKLNAAGNTLYYVCTICNWENCWLHEANKHSLSCGYKEPQQPAFQSYSKNQQEKKQ